MMRISHRWVMAAVAGAALATPAIAALLERKPPYYASIAPATARMRTGPGRAYPANWIYRRAGLPVKVLAVYKEKGGAVWRKVQDPGGTEGWMLSQLISDNRTAVITGATTELRNQPRADAKVNWRAEAGVVGRISRCGDGWCWFDVLGRAGFAPIDRLWGVDADEAVN